MTDTIIFSIFLLKLLFNYFYLQKPHTDPTLVQTELFRLIINNCFMYAFGRNKCFVNKRANDDEN